MARTIKVALDTQICIWAVREVLVGGSVDNSEQTISKKEKALALVDCLAREKIEIVIPAVVLAELLVPLDDATSRAFMTAMDSRFEILEFDAYCAVIYGKNYGQGKRDDAKIKTMKDFGITRREMINDHLIVATCVTNKVDCIFSDDQKLRSFCDGLIRARELPDIPMQQRVDGPWEIDRSASAHLKELILGDSQDFL